MYLTVGFVQEMLVLYGIALLGFFTRKTGILKENASEVVTTLVLYITLPALILFTLDISFSYTMVQEFSWLIVMSLYMLIISCFIARWMRKRSILPEKQKCVYEGLIIFGNQGFIGYAVIFMLFGEQGIVYLTVFNIIYLLFIWLYGIYIFSNNKNIVNWKNIFLNPGILSTLTGIIMFFLPIGWPSFIANGLEMVGKMTIPLSMMMIGILLANIESRTFLTIVKNHYLWKMAFTKLLIIPLLLLPFVFISVPPKLLTVAVIVSGMPSAPTISLYAQKYGADSLFGAFGTLLTTLLCLITIPLLYLLLLTFLS